MEFSRRVRVNSFGEGAVEGLVLCVGLTEDFLVLGRTLILCEERMALGWTTDVEAEAFRTIVIMLLLCCVVISCSLFWRWRVRSE